MLGRDDGNELGSDDKVIEGAGDGGALGLVLGPDDGNALGCDDGDRSLVLTGALVGGVPVMSPSLGEALGNDIDGWAVRSYLCDIKISWHEHGLCFTILRHNCYIQYVCKLHLPAWDSTSNRAACEDILELFCYQKCAPYVAVSITVKLATKVGIKGHGICLVVGALRRTFGTRWRHGWS